jgi:hypothetical protein
MRLLSPAVAGWLLLLSPATYSQNASLPGGRGLVHLASAWTLDRGVATVHAYTSTFFKNDIVPGANGQQRGVTFWDIQGAISINYASGRHFEWAATEIVYQDTHKGGKGYNTPDDLFLKLKIGSLGSTSSPFRFGFLLESRIPIASQRNIVLEPYSSGRVEGGITGLLSYSPDVLIPEKAFNLHLNLGYWFYNDAGLRVNGKPILGPSRHVAYGIGFAVPSRLFDFSLELTGRAFVERPPKSVFSRDDFIFLTPGVTYRPYKNLSFQLGMDVRLTSVQKETLEAVRLPSPNFPGYPPWRVRFGVKFQLGKTSPELPPETGLARAGDGEGEMTALEQLAQERRQTQRAIQDLERIRMQREQLQTVLARLRRLLEYGTEVTDEKEGKTEVTQKNP